jgi:hypothetical protein
MAYEKSTTRLVFALCTLMLFAGCYSPSLGDTPFRCARTGKRCPDDYTCKLQGSTEICVKGGGATRPDIGVDLRGTDAIADETKDGAVVIDGAIVRPTTPATCDDHNIEDNNSAETAWVLTSTGTIPKWQVCYPGDIDHYAVNLNKEQTVRFKIEFTHANGDLELVLYDPSGVEIASSRGEDNFEQIEIKVTQSGRYVFAVWGFQGAVNKYDIVYLVL